MTGAGGKQNVAHKRCGIRIPAWRGAGMAVPKEKTIPVGSKANPSLLGEASTLEIEGA
jgi:hypothetical protein